MSSQGNGQRTVYQVHMSQHDSALLKQRHREAAQAGRGKQFMAALRHIIERLKKDPLEFGEPLYSLPALRLLVRQGMVLPLLVDYAVHQDRPLVFVRGFKVFS